MSDRYFVDTNILLYAHDPAAGEKHQKARALVEELWHTRSGVVSTQVLQELTVNLRKKARKPLDAKATRDIVTDYLAWHVVLNGGESILETIDLESRYRLSFWDALVVQAAQASGARSCTPRTSPTDNATDRSGWSIRCASRRSAPASHPPPRP
jgi:predicted nucleic acid-binding protein